MDPLYNKPLLTKALGETNDIFQPSNIVMYEREPRYSGTPI